MQRTTIRLNEQLLARAKEYALRHRRSLTAVIEDALRALLSTRPKKTGHSSTKLPTYGKGGTLPGVPSLDCYGDVLEYMEKDLPIEKRR